MIRYTIKAVIFDLDGTLIHSSLDLEYVRRQLGLASLDMPLLESIRHLRGQDRQEAMRFLLVHELAASRQSMPAWRAGSTIRSLQVKGIKVGILTRNQRTTTLEMARMHGLGVDYVIGREDGPLKPDPSGLLWMCSIFDVDPSQTLMVGDHLIDLTTARRAGAISVFLRHPKSRPQWATHADLVIQELPELLDRIG